MENKVVHKNRSWQGTYDLFESIAIAVVLVVLIFTLLFRIFVVKGPSMESTLIEGDRIIVSNLFYTPERGDVIVFSGKYNNGEVLVKRIIAVAGDTIDITQDGKVILNGSELSEPYLDAHQVTFTPLMDPSDFPYTVQKDELFVMGDNRLESLDSRSTLVGIAERKKVLGKVVFRLFPNIGVIDDGK